VCERIKANPRTSHLPVVLVTGAMMPAAVQSESRADCILDKPAAPATLKAVVRRLLAARATVR
jgi:CheY-like chemotaxis protein